MKILAIVNHITAGSFPGCLNWLCNPAAKASAHYLINQKGEIYQLAKDEDAAWHAGIANKPIWPLYNGRNPNLYTIGIEHELVRPGDPFSEAMIEATIWLHRQLIQKHGIPVDEAHIIGHNHIDTVNRPNDPGPSFPWQRLFAALRGQPTVTAEPRFILNGKAVNIPLTVINGRTYLELRAFANAVGAKRLQWDGQTRTVYFDL
ncbi:MAG: N-acetylmuramoyl-L-alanine amidase [Bacillota bacterium]